MKDIKLWHQLHTKSPDTKSCAELLEALTRQPIEDRFAFFGFADHLYASEDSKIRENALAMLSGAGGLPAIRLFIKGLSDDCSNVKAAAVKALHHSAGLCDDTLWAHAIFHQLSDVRRKAIAEALETTRQCDDLIYYLLYDRDNKDLVIQWLQTRAHQITAPVAAPVILAEACREGEISKPLARRLAEKLLLSPRMWKILQFYSTRTLDTAESLILACSNNQEDIQWPDEKDSLDLAIELLWDKSQAPDATAKDPFNGLLELFFPDESKDPWPALAGKGRTVSSETKSTYANRAILVSKILQCAWFSKTWYEKAGLTCLLLYPQLLLCQWLPQHIKIESVQFMHDSAKDLPRFSTKTLKPLLKSTFCRNKGGQLDLWRIYGILKYAKGNPVQHAESIFGLDALVQACCESSEKVVSLFLNDAKGSLRSKLLEAFLAASVKGTPKSAAEYLWRSPADQWLHFQVTDRDTYIETFVEICLMLDQPEIKLSEKRTAKLAKFFADRLFSDTLEHQIKFCRRWLGDDSLHCHFFGIDVLCEIARNVGAEGFVSIAVSIAESLNGPFPDDPDKTKLINRFFNAVTMAAAIPLDIEMALAHAFVRHPNPEILGWCVEMIETFSEKPPETPVLQKPAELYRLSDSEQNEIIGCPEASLSDIVGAYKNRIAAGICAALQKRSDPVTPDISICAVLLASVDPWQDVDRQIARFFPADTDFWKTLDAELPRIPPEAASSLYNSFYGRWEKHAFSFENKVLNSQEDLIQVLNQALYFSSGFLREQVWSTVDCLMGFWQRRSKYGLKKMISRQIIDILISALPTDVGMIAAKMLNRLHNTEMKEYLRSRQSEILWLRPELQERTVKLVAQWIPHFDTPVADTASDKPSQANLSSHSIIPDKSPAVKGPGEQCWSLQQPEVENAADKLLGSGETGAACITGMILKHPRPHHWKTLAAKAAFFPEGQSLSLLRETVPDKRAAPEVRFHIALAFSHNQNKSNRFKTHILEAINTDVAYQWFQSSDWEALESAGFNEVETAVQVIASSQILAYFKALKALLSLPCLKSSHLDALEKFLLAGTSRYPLCRLEAATVLFNNHRLTGAPIFLRFLFLKHKSTRNRFPQLKETVLPRLLAASEMIDPVVHAVMAAGEDLAHENRLTDKFIFNSMDLNNAAKQQISTLLLKYSRNRSTIRTATAMRISDKPNPVTRALAVQFAWGVKTAKSLTMKNFRFLPATEDDLGYTNLESNEIYISPLPFLQSAPNADKIVQGLMLHELGHHMYHARNLHVDEMAQQEDLIKIFNLVEDEHLERNLRALDHDYGNRLHKLAAYAFKHSQNEFPIALLLELLPEQAFRLLSGIPLKAAREKGHIKASKSRLFSAMEKLGSSFTRFVHALRMGTGNRHKDPKVEKALKLFDKSFRRKDKSELLEIAREIKKIFPRETFLMEALDMQSLIRPELQLADQTPASGQISTQQIQKEVEQILQDESNRTDRASLFQESASEAETGKIINKENLETFDEIDRIRKIAYAPVAYHDYALEVARPARRLRRFFKRLGLDYQTQRHRTCGRALDYSRLAALVVQKDPRVLKNRVIRRHTSLYVGILIDCSGSMSFSGLNGTENITRAKLFGVMLAEATRPIEGVEMHFWGFTDDTIYDAGNAKRCCVPKLSSGGGNNDAAALWHAAQQAHKSRKPSRLLVMISDGSPTECTLPALKNLVKFVTTRMRIACAQVALEPLAPDEIAFDHYIELSNSDTLLSANEFGRIISRQINRAMGGK